MDVTELSMLLEAMEPREVSPEEFMEAVTKVKTVKNLPQEQQLVLYGLFKQYTTGDVSGPEPELSDFVGKAKWYGVLLSVDSHPLVLQCCSIALQGRLERIPRIPAQQRGSSLCLYCSTSSYGAGLERSWRFFYGWLRRYCQHTQVSRGNEFYCTISCVYLF